MIEDEAEKENKNKVPLTTFVVDMVLDNDHRDDDKENIEIQMGNLKYNVNEKECVKGKENKNENQIKYENETDKMNRIENENLVERNIHRVSLIVNTISSLSPSPMSVGLGMSPMTGTITPTTQMTQERYVEQCSMFVSV